MADPVDPLRRRPPIAPDVRGVHRSNAAVERRKRREREEEEARRRGEAEESAGTDGGEAGETDEDGDTGTHVDLRV